MRQLLDFLRAANRPCRDMTALISASLDQRLPWSQRWAFRLHILYCTSCRRYRRQVEALRAGLRRLGEAIRTGGDATGPALAPVARERIHKAIQRL